MQNNWLPAISNSGNKKYSKNDISSINTHVAQKMHIMNRATSTCAAGQIHLSSITNRHDPNPITKVMPINMMKNATYLG